MEDYGMSHPPKDTAIDVIRSGLHVGSSVVRDFIVQYKPDVCISGHIHESRARDKVGRYRSIECRHVQGWMVHRGCY